MRGLLSCACFVGTTMETKDGSNWFAKASNTTPRTGNSLVLKRKFSGENELKTQCFLAENTQQLSWDVCKYFFLGFTRFHTNDELVTVTC